MSIGGKIRRIFLAGLFTAIPLYFTYKVLEVIIQFMDRFLAPIIQPIIERSLGFRIPGLGMVLMIISLFILGLFVTNFLGRALYGWFEKILLRIPVVSNVYNFAKQIMQTLAPEQRKAFQKVVWLQYPRPGLWTLGFVTGTTESADGEPHYNIFVATTPNPTSGYVVFVAQKDTIQSNMTIEEGFKLLISGGTISSGSHNFRYDKTFTSATALPEVSDKSGTSRRSKSSQSREKPNRSGDK